MASRRAGATSPGGPIAECQIAGLRGVTSASQRFARWRPLKLGHRLSPDMLQQLTAGRDDYQSVESTTALAFAGTKNSRRASTLGDRPRQTTGVPVVSVVPVIGSPVSDGGPTPPVTQGFVVHSRVLSPCRKLVGFSPRIPRLRRGNPSCPRS